MDWTLIWYDNNNLGNQSRSVAPSIPIKDYTEKVNQDLKIFDSNVEYIDYIIPLLFEIYLSLVSSTLTNAHLIL